MNALLLRGIQPGVTPVHCDCGRRGRMVSTPQGWRIVEVPGGQEENG